MRHSYKFRLKNFLIQNLFFDVQHYSTTQPQFQVRGVQLSHVRIQPLCPQKSGRQYQPYGCIVVAPAMQTGFPAIEGCQWRLWTL